MSNRGLAICIVILVCAIIAVLCYAGETNVCVALRADYYASPPVRRQAEKIADMCVGGSNALMWTWYTDGSADWAVFNYQWDQLPTNLTALIALRDSLPLRPNKALGYIGDDPAGYLRSVGLTAKEGK